MSFEITPAAEKFIRLTLRVDGGPGAGFRLAVKPGGCSGLTSDINVTSQPAEGDSVVEYKGIKFFMTAESRILLHGVTIDFIDTPAQTGLVFRQPLEAGLMSKAVAKAAR